MSQIQKMSIQGIRSFGPDDTNRQAITFFNPLTLILGPNGTGKTTVIECLKYITTGDLPPAHKDAAFVHDPKIARESTVNGQVRLQLTDVRGNRYIVQRSLQATQKVKSVSMKTLEGVITFQTKDGRKQSNTTRCVDLNKEMTSLLGVSKPVLENVIFCHQEESNWPLSEGKALKQKFDDIFASTRYVKALECIRKFRTDQVGTVREFQAEIKYLKQNKEKSADIAADLDEVKAKYLASKETVQGIEEKLHPIQEKLEQIGNQEGDIWKLHTKIEGLKIEKNQLEKQQQELRDKIDNEFTGTTDELEQKLRDFEKKVAEREEKLKKLEKKLVSIEQDINSLSQEKGDLLVKQGKLEQEATQHKENTNQRNEKIRSMADAYAIQGFSGNIEDRHVKKFLEVLQKNAEDVIKQAKEKRGEFEEHEKRIQMEIDKLKKTKTELETEHKMKSDTMGKNKEEIKRLNKELSRVDASADRLSSIRDELRSKEHELKEIDKSLNTDEMKQEVTKLQNDRTTMDAKLKQLNNELNRLHAESSTRTQLDMLKKDRITKQDQIRKLKAKNEDSLQHILGHIPPDNLRNDLDDYIRNIGSEIQRENKHIEKLKMELAGKEMERKHMQDQLGKKEKELNGYEEKIFSECESQNFDEGLEKLESKIRTNQQTHGLLIGTKEVFNKYMRTLEKSGDPPCPLCHRPFDNHSEVEELIAEIRNKLKLVPDKLEKVSHDIDEYQGKFNRMQQLKPLRSNIIDLRDTEIPDLKKRQKTVDGRITHLKEEIEEKSDSLEAKESDKAMADSLTRDVYMIDKYQTELRDLDRKIGTQSAKIAGSDSERTVTIVATERDDIQMTLDGVNRQLDHKRQKLSDHGEKLQQVRSDINELVADKLQIETDLQQRQKLEGEKAVLASTLDTLDREIQDASQQITPLQTKIESQMKEKNKVTDRKEKEFDKAKDEFNQIKSSGKEVSSINDQIQQYFSQGRDKELKKCETLMRQMEEDASEKDGEREELTTGITRIRKDLDTQKSREREMSDNMALRKKEEQVAELREKMDTLKEKLGGLDVTKLEREKNKLKREQEKYEQDKHTAVGRQMGLQDQIKQFTKEINSDQFKDADVKYRDKMILLRTTELANADLDKYYKALDRTIMAYHSQKMSEINKIIRELWRNTYRGNDIETIEIRSDADEGESGAIKRRRVYNYRVVMLRGDAALDMRGRCSAGQKVLASLIIRLALAETFCLNCGILALDEPTTNLDRENIESLAYALVEIIKQRAKQKNFQLIVITHDEDFVELLGRADFVEEFYKVKKDNQGFSCLAKAKVEDMQSR